MGLIKHKQNLDNDRNHSFSDFADKDDYYVWGEHNRNYPYAVAMHLSAYTRMLRHMSRNRNREVGGILLGRKFKYDVNDRLYIGVEYYLDAELANEQPLSLTFTNETWLQLDDEQERVDSSNTLLRVGWAHTHPTFGIFLSRPMDEYIQNAWFNKDWQIAIVVDPVNNEAGIFQRDIHGDIMFEQATYHFSTGKPTTLYSKRPATSNQVKVAIPAGLPQGNQSNVVQKPAIPNAVLQIETENSDGQHSTSKQGTNAGVQSLIPENLQGDYEALNIVRDGEGSIQFSGVTKPYIPIQDEVTSQQTFNYSPPQRLQSIAHEPKDIQPDATLLARDQENLDRRGIDFVLISASILLFIAIGIMFIYTPFAVINDLNIPSSGLIYFILWLAIILLFGSFQTSKNDGPIQGSQRYWATLEVSWVAAMLAVCVPFITLGFVVLDPLQSYAWLTILFTLSTFFKFCIQYYMKYR